MAKLIILCGPPATGKGYFTHLMLNIFEENNLKEKVQVIAIGEILRTEIQEGNEEAKEITIEGETQKTCKILTTFFAKDLDRTKEYIIIDGLPRTQLQLEKFQEITNDDDVHIVFLNGDDKILLQKMIERSKIEHRADDTVENFHFRMKTYRKFTYPAIKNMKKIYRKNFIEASTNSDMTKTRVKNILKKIGINLS